MQISFCETTLGNQVDWVLVSLHSVTSASLPFFVMMRKDEEDEKQSQRTRALGNADESVYFINYLRRLRPST